MATEAGGLPERADVWWRPLIDDAALDRYARGWTLTMAAHVAGFLAPGILLLALEPLTFPMLALCGMWAWVVPGLYAGRGAKALTPAPSAGTPAAEQRALGMLGDLLGHDARVLYEQSGLVLERGRLGVWLIGDGGAALVRRRRGAPVVCFCVRAADRTLPRADRTSHLLLALRTDEPGFATVANRVFAGARWRVRARLPEAMRPALERAAALALDSMDGSAR